MSIVVEADEKGRILLPMEIRRRIRAKRFRVTTRGESIELQPLKSPDVLQGKYRRLIKLEWEELEERSEDFVAKGQR
jgi:bifunctional DNA-binding transcriptional regulator/antitoxin component of YhaV-PrlF toxin-antitoxin module